MSVGLFKFDGDRYNHNSNVILSKSVVSEEKYNKYLEKAIKELNIQYFRDGGEIRKKDVQLTIKEIEKLIVWVNKNVKGNDLIYLNERLVDLREIIPESLNNDDEVLYIF